MWFAFLVLPVDPVCRSATWLIQRTYTDKLNLALRELRNRGGAAKDLAKLGIDTLLSRLDEVPEDLRAPIRNNGGGYVNHDLFWQSMSPPSPNGTDGTPPLPREPAPESKIAQAIVRDFGSFAAFRQQFTDMAMGVFGSGWVFLYVDGAAAVAGASAAPGPLRMRATANQDNPVILDSNAHHLPLMALDLWEHCYYLDFKNNRQDFIHKWWNIVAWPRIEQKYVSFLTFSEIMAEEAEKREAKKAAAAAAAAAAPAATPAAEAPQETKDGL